MTKEDILKKFEGFTDGVRVLILVQRNKEGGNNRRDKGSIKRKVSKNKEEFAEILSEFLEIKNSSDIPLRIYSSVNPRNIEKAIRLFKFEQLEADFYDIENKHNFYYDIRNRWVGVVASPKAKSGTLFLIDIDHTVNRANVDSVKEALETRGIKIVLDYKTKNGNHIITEPFNPQLVESLKLEIKTDGMLLLDF